MLDSLYIPQLSLQGDRIVVECTYDSTGRTEPTFVRILSQHRCVRLLSQICMNALVQKRNTFQLAALENSIFIA